MQFLKHKSIITSNATKFVGKKNSLMGSLNVFSPLAFD